jgi:hypothetical protein
MADNENPTRLRRAGPAQDDQRQRQRVLARWEDEGGATPCGPQEAVRGQTRSETDATLPGAGASPQEPGA